jgi:hypothetical protein
MEETRVTDNIIYDITTQLAAEAIAGQLPAVQ